MLNLRTSGLLMTSVKLRITRNISVRAVLLEDRLPYVVPGEIARTRVLTLTVFRTDLTKTKKIFMANYPDLAWQPTVEI